MFQLGISATNKKCSFKHVFLSFSLPGFEISSDTWPALVKVTDGKGDPEFSLSWFIPPGTTTPENSDPLVQLESKPEATVYVR